MMLSYNETPQDDAEWRCFFGAEGSGGPGLKAIHARMRPRREDPFTERRARSSTSSLAPPMRAVT